MRDIGAIFGIAPPSGDFQSNSCPLQTTETAHIVDIPIEKLHPHSKHRSNYTDDEMEALIESIREHGVKDPIYVRPDRDGFEVISGHHRTEACRRLNIGAIPAIVEEMDDDTADILMVELYLKQRKHVKTSELAHSYRVEYEALRRQGKRTDLIDEENSGATGTQAMAEKEQKSQMTLFRYYRLGHLNEALLDLIDTQRFNISAGVQLSYLDEDAQNTLAGYLQTHDKVKPSEGQAKQLRDLADTSPLSSESIASILDARNKEKKARSLKAVKVPVKKIRDCFSIEEISGMDEPSLIDLIVKAVRAYKGLEVNSE